MRASTNPSPINPRRRADPGQKRPLVGQMIARPDPLPPPTALVDVLAPLVPYSPGIPWMGNEPIAPPSPDCSVPGHRSPVPSQSRSSATIPCYPIG